MKNTSWKHTFLLTPGAPYKPAWTLLRDLASLDPGLRLRWSDRHEQWSVEKRCRRGIFYISTLRQYVKRKDGVIVENDSWVLARDGYEMIDLVPAKPVLDTWLIRGLQAHDIHRLGGAEAVDRMLADKAEAKLAKQARQLTNTNEEISKDFFDTERVRQGERVYVPGEEGSHARVSTESKE